MRANFYLTIERCVLIQGGSKIFAVDGETETERVCVCLCECVCMCECAFIRNEIAGCGIVVGR